MCIRDSDTTDTTVESEDNEQANDLPDSQNLESRDDLVDTSNGLVTLIEEVDEDTLRVEYELGDPACFGAQINVTETEELIEVGVVVGSLPDVAPDECEDFVGFFFTDVDLESPVDGRPQRAAEPVETSS